MLLGCNHCKRKFRSRGAWAAHLATCTGWLKASGINKLVSSPKKDPDIKIAKPIHLIWILKPGGKSKTWCGKYLDGKERNLTQLPVIMTCKACRKSYLKDKPRRK